jgi:hypothetical protein
MKLLIQSAMIFFGTLMAAAVVALGEPAQADVALATSAAPSMGQGARHGARGPLAWVELASNKAGPSLR